MISRRASTRPSWVALLAEPVMQVQPLGTVAVHTAVTIVSPELQAGVVEVLVAVGLVVGALAVEIVTLGTVLAVAVDVGTAVRRTADPGRADPGRAELGSTGRLARRTGPRRGTSVAEAGCTAVTGRSTTAWREAARTAEPAGPTATAHRARVDRSRSLQRLSHGRQSPGRISQRWKGRWVGGARGGWMTSSSSSLEQGAPHDH